MTEPNAERRVPCLIADHDAPVEPVPDAVEQRAVPIPCPHCARELRDALHRSVEDLEASMDRERGWKVQAQDAERRAEAAERDRKSQNQLAEARRGWDAAAALASERLDVSGLKDQDRLRLQAERDEARRALEDMREATKTLTIKRVGGGLSGYLVVPGVETLCNTGDFDSVSDEEVRAAMLRVLRILALGRPAPDGETRRLADDKENA